MTGRFLPFAGGPYCAMFALLVLSRALDLFSTWVATPNLVLEGNPLARKMGWKIGALVNLALCLAFAFWPLTAIMIVTTGFLVAGRNFRLAWLMRTMGEDAYRDWYLEQFARARFGLHFSCLLGETLTTAAVGAGLMLFSGSGSVAYAVGAGIAAYAAVVMFYTALSLWRLRPRLG